MAKDFTEAGRMDIETLRAAITSAFPELSDARFTLLTAGWDSVAVDVDDRLIFKFPRSEDAKKGLRTEARLLAVIRPAVTMPVPDMTIHPGPPLFSRHEKLKGEHLVAAQYELLSEEAREKLAADMALFFAELHRLEMRDMAAAGAGPIRPWLEPDEVLRRTWPALSHELRVYAERTIEAWRGLPPDPYGMTYGFFDGHGWNMAFDHATSRLNGIYDFGDSGFAPLQQEFVYPNWISPDLTARIVSEYEALTGRLLDRRRIDLLSGVLRLSELAQEADNPDWAPIMLRNVADWAVRSAG